MQLQKGTTFDSAHDALQCIETFARANSHPLRKTNTVTVKEYNKKVSEHSRLPDDLMFQSLHWQCKHFGQYKSKGKGIRNVTRTFAKGCPVQLTVVYNRMLNKFVLSTLVLEHQNHAVSEEIFKLYPDNRRPHGSTAQEVDNMLQVHGNPTLVAEVLHKQGHAVRVKDLYNRKRVVNNCKTTLSVRLDNLLTQSHVHFKILTNSKMEFSALFFQTDHQRDMFNKYGELLQRDATYKVVMR